MSTRHRPINKTKRTENGKASATAAKEIRSMLLSVTAIRILNCAANGPIRDDQLRQRVQVSPIHTATLGRTVRRMRNNGWLKTKNVASSASRADRVHLITPRGRRTLRALVSTFKDLFTSWTAR